MSMAAAGPAPGTAATRSAFFAVVALFVLYAAAFIYRTSFVIHGERYFSLFDDAMVSMRYGRNLAHGLGLVWNPGGERVEGFTNPLWVIYMAAIHLLPIAESKTSLVVQLTGAAVLVANLWFVHRLAHEACGGSEPVAVGAAALTAAYLPINNWSLQGMEVGVLVAVTTFAAWQSLLAMRDGRFRPVIYLVLGASTLVRLDMAVPAVVLTLVLAGSDRANRARHLAWSGSALIGFVAVQEACRLWYYHDLLPNTYYLKMTGVSPLLRVSRGLFVLGQFAWKFNLVLFVLPFTLAMRRDQRVTALLALFVGQLAYSAYVGGDAWEYWGGSNRYIAIAMPAFFVLLSYSLFLVAGTVAAAGAGRRVVYATIVLVAMLCANSIYGLRAWTEVLLVHPPLHSGPGDENSREVEEALRLRSITAPDATITVVRAGTIPYFADRPSIDLLGKNDRYIARLPARLPSGIGRFVAFRPGHVKYDYSYSIEQQAPDVIVQLWEHPESIATYIEAHYDQVLLGGNRVYVRKGSSRVLQGIVLSMHGCMIRACENAAVQDFSPSQKKCGLRWGLQSSTKPPDL